MRRRRLLERYALLWLFSAAVLLALAIWDGLLSKLAESIGIATPVNALFFVAFGFVLVLLLHFSLAVSRQADQTKVLAQRLALLEERQRRAETQRADVDLPESDTARVRTGWPLQLILRVGFDLAFLLPGESGGRETYVRELAVALAAARPDLELVSIRQPRGEDDAVGESRACRAAAAVAPVTGGMGLGGARCGPGCGGRANVDVLHAPANFGPVDGAVRSRAERARPTLPPPPGVAHHDDGGWERRRYCRPPRDEPTGDHGLRRFGGRLTSHLASRRNT